METKELYKRAMNKFGVEKQLVVVMEECAELIKECSKRIRNKDNINNLAEEIVDVQIMCEQIVQHYSLKKSIEFHREEKINKLKNLIGE